MESNLILYILQCILGIIGICLLIGLLITANKNRRLYLFKVIPKDNEDAWYITAGRLKWSSYCKQSILKTEDGLTLSSSENSILYLPYEIIYANQFRNIRELMEYCYNIYSGLCETEQENISLNSEQEDDE